jgi:DNA repair exonuclease SbcCD ATPase subunit
MSDINQIIEHTASQLQNLDGETATAQKAVDQLTGELENLMSELESEWSALATRSETLIGRAETSDEEIRTASDKVTEALISLDERVNSAQSDVESNAPNAHKSVQNWWQRVADSAAESKGGLGAVAVRCGGLMSALKASDEKLETSRAGCDAYLRGDLASATEAAQEKAETTMQALQAHITEGLLPAIGETAGDFAGLMEQASQEVENQFRESARKAAEIARSVMDGLSQTISDSVQILTSSVDEVDEVMDKATGFIGASAQSVSTVMGAMSEASETTATGLTSAVEILDDVQSILRRVG